MYHILECRIDMHWSYQRRVSEGGQGHDKDPTESTHAAASDLSRILDGSNYGWKFWATTAAVIILGDLLDQSAYVKTRSRHGLAPLDFQHMVSSLPDGAANEGKAFRLPRVLVPSFLRSSSLAVFSFAGCYRKTCSCIKKPIRCGNMIPVLPSTRKWTNTSQIET